MQKQHVTTILPASVNSSVFTSGIRVNWPRVILIRTYLKNLASFSSLRPSDAFIFSTKCAAVESRKLMKWPWFQQIHMITITARWEKPKVRLLTLKRRIKTFWLAPSFWLKNSVASINDKEELNATDESFDILGFDQEEKNAIYRITAGLMHGGNMKFKQKPREEQAEPDGLEAAELAGFMLGMGGAEYCKERFKSLLSRFLFYLIFLKKFCFVLTYLNVEKGPLSAKSKSWIRICNQGSDCRSSTLCFESHLQGLLWTSFQLACYRKNLISLSTVLLARFLFFHELLVIYEFMVMILNFFESRQPCLVYKLTSFFLYWYSRYCRIRNFWIQHFRAALYQLHKRKTSAIFQPPYVCFRAGRIQERRFLKLYKG